MSSPRNVIILHCDSMRGDCSGFDGNRDALTPRLDAFAAEATVLARHFTVARQVRSLAGGDDDRSLRAQ